MGLEGGLEKDRKGRRAKNARWRDGRDEAKRSLCPLLAEAVSERSEETAHKPKLSPEGSLPLNINRRRENKMKKKPRVV